MDYDDLDELNQMLGLHTIVAGDDVDIELTAEEKAEAEAWLNEPDAPEKVEREDDGFDF